MRARTWCALVPQQLCAALTQPRCCCALARHKKQGERYRGGLGLGFRRRRKQQGQLSPSTRALPAVLPSTALTVQRPAFPRRKVDIYYLAPLR